MLTYLGIALCAYLILMAGWLYVRSTGIRNLRTFAVIAVVDLGVAILLFALASPLSATALMVAAAALLVVCSLLVRRLRPRPYRTGLSPNGPLGIHGAAGSRSWDDLEADLDPPGTAGGRRGRRID